MPLNYGNQCPAIPLARGAAPKKLDLRQSRHEIADESSKIVPLGAPLSEGPLAVDFDVFFFTRCVARRSFRKMLHC